MYSGGISSIVLLQEPYIPSYPLPLGLAEAGLDGKDIAVGEEERRGRMVGKGRQEGRQAGGARKII